MISKPEYIPQEPYKWDAVKDRFLRYLRQGATRHQAAKRCMLEPKTVSRWGKIARIDMEMVAAEEEFYDLLERFVQCKDYVNPECPAGAKPELLVNPDRALKILQARAEAWKLKQAVEQTQKISIMELMENSEHVGRVTDQLSDIDGIE